MSYNELDFDGRNIVFAFSEVKDMFRMHFERGCQYVAKGILEKVMAADFEGFVGAGRYARLDSRRGYRNGYRRRSLVTSVGVLARVGDYYILRNRLLVIRFLSATAKCKRCGNDVRVPVRLTCGAASSNRI